MANVTVYNMEGKEAKGEVNGKPAYYNPVTRQSLTADSDGKYKLRDW